MLGWKLFSHSVRMVLVNWPHALKISVPLILCNVAAFLLAGQAILSGIDVANPGEGAGGLLLALPLILIGSLWTIVAWHRFILLEEYPKTIPPLRFGRILSYFGTSFVLGLLIGLLLMIGLGVGALIAGVAPILFVILTFVMTILGIWVFYRLSPVLPASAIEKPTTMREAWESTGAMSGATLIAAALTFVLSFVLAFASELLAVAIPATALASGVASNCLLTLVGASLLTTIYGVAVEKRAL